ncbi:CHAT domain-containing protein [Bradyrhizobium sp. CB1717]|uniref:CHAT domain-containing protein n=1 Tax=Bradyrhizobium sp. CB1717 TaxID=3039154 RepID=UPI0024B23C71|nr:CHAT domain-containing protein [Bradyrhizobium sp. CB1717]WFU20817.1 CHAT domain-containing protein [Bradyrhizobium sp. CB1717]
MLLAVNQLLTEVRLQRLSGVRGRDRLAAAERLAAHAALLTQRVIKAASLLEVADAWLDEEPDKARRFAVQARGLVDETSAPNVTALSLAIEADAAMKGDEPRPECAYDLTQRAIKLARQHRERITDPILRATAMRDRIRVFESATSAAMAAGHLACALKAAENQRPALPSEPPLDLKLVQDALHIGELAIVYTWLATDRLLVATVERNALQSVSVTVDPEALRILESFSAHLRNGEVKGWSFTPKEAELLDVLCPVLLPCLVTSRLASVRKLFILPHRSLHAIPFSMLRFEERRLGLRFPWTTIPNLGAIHRRIPVADGRGVVAVGIDYYPDARPTRGFDGAAEEIVARHEARGLPASRLAEPGACKSFARMLAVRELDHAAFLLLACHGTSAQGDVPGESFLQLGSERLTADMISTSRVPADLVVLVACCSGQRAVGGMGIQFWPGDDLFGLQAAFRAAGARQVIGSLWNAEVGAAKTMAGIAYDAWVNGADAAASVQIAALELYKNVLHRAHYDWAPFTAMQFGMKA